MSRIIVKNLGKNTSEKQLKDHFGNKGEVTDVKVMTTKDGKSRRFAFIGFRTDAQASDAQAYFNNTFLGLSRVSVDIAKSVNDKGLRESKTQRMMKKKSASSRGPKEGTAVPKTLLNSNDPKNSNPTGANQKKAEFIEIMKNRQIKNKWGNDDVIMTDKDADEAEHGAPFPVERKLKIEYADNDNDSDGENDSENDSGNDSDDSFVNVSRTNVVKPPQTARMSDLDYLRSKMKKTGTSDSDSSKSDSSDSDSDDDSSDSSNPVDVKRVDSQATTAAAAEEAEEIASEISNKGRNTADSIDNQEREEEEEEEESARLFVKNLPFTCTEDELKTLFAEFGPISELHLPLDEERRGKGFGFVHFMIPEHAEKALQSLSGVAFQGRVLYIVKALRQREKDAGEKVLYGNAAKLSSFQRKKEEERQKFVNRKEGWNSAYVRSDAVVDALAAKHSVSGADILDTSKSGGDMAVRLAIGESQIILENRDFLAQHGVDIDALESNHSQQRAASRSTTTLLVKNLPPGSDPEELESMFARFGSIASFIAPPSKTMVVVDFIEPSEARAAQKGLAYRNYKHSPLYVEWAPLQAIDRDKARKAFAKSHSSKPAELNTSTNDKTAARDEEDTGEDYSTLFVKNLNFSTSETNLRDFLLQSGVEGLRTVLIQKKQIGQHLLSQGYGFIEFKTPDCAARALTQLQGSFLDSHALEIKPSDKRISLAPPSSSSSSQKKTPHNDNENNNKLIVRNVAFQATKEELRGLFAVYGAVKRVRIPKKMGGEHRGFAFIDFSTAQEAALAMASLKNTHLYGRHLVLEWAKLEDEQEGAASSGTHGSTMAGLGYEHQQEQEHHHTGGKGAAGAATSVQRARGGGLRAGTVGATTTTSTSSSSIDRLRKRARDDSRVIRAQQQKDKQRKHAMTDVLEGDSNTMDAF